MMSIEKTATEPLGDHCLRTNSLMKSISSSRAVWETSWRQEVRVRSPSGSWRRWRKVAWRSGWSRSSARVRMGCSMGAKVAAVRQQSTASSILRDRKRLCSSFSRSSQELRMMRLRFRSRLENTQCRSSCSSGSNITSLRSKISARRTSSTSLLRRVFSEITTHSSLRTSPRKALQRARASSTSRSSAAFSPATASASRKAAARSSWLTSIIVSSESTTWNGEGASWKTEGLSTISCCTAHLVSMAVLYRTHTRSSTGLTRLAYRSSSTSSPPRSIGSSSEGCRQRAANSRTPLSAHTIPRISIAATLQCPVSTLHSPYQTAFLLPYPSHPDPVLIGFWSPSG